MRKVSLIISFVLVFIVIATQLIYSSELNKREILNDKLSKVQVTKNLASTPLSFTENRGQWDEKVSFRANAGGTTMWFSFDGAYYQFTRTITSETRPVGLVSPRPVMLNGRKPETYETMLIKANFVGANLNPQMVGIDMIDYKCNYFIGNDESKWATDVPNYRAVMYTEIYHGINLKYYGNGKQMEYDFIVSPGADFSQIKIQYEGAESVFVNDNGELVVTTKWGEVVEQRPVIYQIENNSRIAIDGKYLIQSDNSFSFELSDYDKSLELVIDPILSYSTYLGGTDTDKPDDIAVDASGQLYIVGRTASTDFPTLNPYSGTIQVSLDAYVTKLSSSGSSLIYSTYLGGDANDWVSGIAIDSSGVAYLTGTTSSSDFPMFNPYQGTYQGGSFDAFVTKLSSSGNSLIYSSYLGGSSADLAYSIAVDASGAMCLTGYTLSTDFPTLNPVQGNQVGQDVFVTKLNPAGDSLVYSTYLGGNSSESGEGIAVDNSGSAYIVGGTFSADFPTFNPYQGTKQGASNSRDAFVSKLSSSGSMVYSTFLGGLGSEYGTGIAVDASGAAYVTGTTNYSDFPTVNPNQGAAGMDDAFVTKFNPAGDSLIFSTYLGGTRDDVATSIAIDASGAVYVSGETSTILNDIHDFPLLNEFQSTNNGGTDAFVAKFNSSGSLAYSTYLGGSNVDFNTSIAVDSSGAVYIVGETNSVDFPTLNPYQATFLGSSDLFVTKFEAYLEIYEEVVNPGSNVLAFGSNGQTITFDSVETTGTVTVEYSPIGPGVGANLSVLPIPSPIYYNVSTTAGFVGNFEICFSYDPFNIISEDSVKIYHYDSTGNWVDITTSLDTASNTVCGITDHFSPFVVLVPNIALSVEIIDSPNLPDNFSLSQNYPNPFNPSTTIEFSLPTKSYVTVTIYNLLGQKVNQPVNQELSAGSYQVTWDGTSSNGVKTSTGIYFYRIVTKNFVETKKMLLLK